MICCITKCQNEHKNGYTICSDHVLILKPSRPELQKPKKVEKPKSRKFRNLNKHLYDKELMSKLKLQLMKVYGSNCMRCGTDEDIILEHIVSRFMGGTNDLSNLQLLCNKCNFIKGHNKTDYRP